MADVINSNVAGQVMTGMGAVGTVVIWILAIFCFLLIVFLIWWWNSFKINYRVRIITGSKTIVVEDKAKIIRKKGQGDKWKLRKRKHFVPIPEPDEISIGDKGRLFVEAFYSENGGYTYRKNSNDPKIEVVDPYTQDDKEFYANEHRDGVLKYKKTDWVQILLTLTPIIAIIIIFALFMITFKDAVQPVIDIGNQIVEQRKMDIQFYSQINDIHTVMVGNANNQTAVVGPS